MSPSDTDALTQADALVMVEKPSDAGYRNEPGVAMDSDVETFGDEPDRVVAGCGG